MSYVIGTVMQETPEAIAAREAVDALRMSQAGPKPTVAPTPGMYWGLVGDGTRTAPYKWAQHTLGLTSLTPPVTGELTVAPGAPADPIVEQKEREAAAYCRGRKTGLLIAAGAWVAWRVLR